MASVSGTDVSPYRVGSSAGQMYLTAQEAVAELEGPLDRMRELHSREPWGNDKPGEQFRDSYLGTDGDGGAEAVAESGESILQAVQDLSENAGIGAYQTEKVDDLISDQMENLKDEDEELFPDGEARRIGVIRTETTTADGPHPYADPGGQPGMSRTNDRPRPWQGIRAGMSGGAQFKAFRRLSSQEVAQRYQDWMRQVQESGAPQRYFALSVSRSALLQQQELADQLSQQQQQPGPPLAPAGTAGAPEGYDAVGASGSALQEQRELGYQLSQQQPSPPPTAAGSAGEPPAAGAEPTGTVEAVAGPAAEVPPAADPAAGPVAEVPPATDPAAEPVAEVPPATDPAADAPAGGDSAEVSARTESGEQGEESPLNRTARDSEPAHRVVSPWAGGTLLRNPSDRHLGMRLDLLGGGEPPAAI